MDSYTDSPAGLIKGLARWLPWFTQPEEPVEEEVFVPAPSRKEVGRERRRQAKGIRSCELLFGDTAFNAMELKHFEGGADIRLPRHLKQLPNFFTLKFTSSEEYDCEVLQRDGDKVRVIFL